MKSLIVFLVLSFSLCSFAKSSVEIKNAYVRFPPPGSTTSALFFEVINNDNIDHKILKVSGSLSDDFELHEMNMSEGKMTMRKVDAILLKKKSTTSLKPGGLHVMIFNLKKPLKESEVVDLVIELESQEKIQTKAVVKLPN